MIFSFVQRFDAMFKPRIITLYTTPLHKESFQYNQNSKIKVINTFMRQACKTFFYGLFDLERYLEECDDAEMCRSEDGVQFNTPTATARLKFIMCEEFNPAMN